MDMKTISRYFLIVPALLFSSHAFAVKAKSGSENSAFAAYVLLTSKGDDPAFSGLIARGVFPAGINCSDVNLSLTQQF